MDNNNRSLGVSLMVFLFFLCCWTALSSSTAKTKEFLSRKILQCLYLATVTTSLQGRRNPHTRNELTKISPLMQWEFVATNECMLVLNGYKTARNQTKGKLATSALIHLWNCEMPKFTPTLCQPRRWFETSLVGNNWLMKQQFLNLFELGQMKISR